MKDGSIKLDSSAALLCSTVSCSKLISSTICTAVLSLSATQQEKSTFISKAAVMTVCVGVCGGGGNIGVRITLSRLLPRLLGVTIISSFSVWPLFPR